MDDKLRKSLLGTDWYDSEDEESEVETTTSINENFIRKQELVELTSDFLIVGDYDREISQLGGYGFRVDDSTIHWNRHFMRTLIDKTSMSRSSDKTFLLFKTLFIESKITDHDEGQYDMCVYGYKKKEYDHINGISKERIDIIKWNGSRRTIQVDMVGGLSPETFLNNRKRVVEERFVPRQVGVDHLKTDFHLIVQFLYCKRMWFNYNIHMVLIGDYPKCVYNTTPQYLKCVEDGGDMQLFIDRLRPVIIATVTNEAKRAYLQLTGNCVKGVDDEDIVDRVNEKDRDSFTMRMIISSKLSNMFTIEEWLDLDMGFGMRPLWWQFLSKESKSSSVERYFNLDCLKDNFKKMSMDQQKQYKSFMQDKPHPGAIIYNSSTKVTQLKKRSGVSGKELDLEKAFLQIFPYVGLFVSEEKTSISIHLNTTVIISPKDKEVIDRDENGIIPIPLEKTFGIGCTKEKWKIKVGTFTSHLTGYDLQYIDARLPNSRYILNCEPIYLQSCRDLALWFEERMNGLDDSITKGFFKCGYQQYPNYIYRIGSNHHLAVLIHSVERHIVHEALRVTDAKTISADAIGNFPSSKSLKAALRVLNVTPSSSILPYVFKWRCKK